MVKQLKNRYNDPSTYRRFVVGVDRSKMRLYDVEQSGQDDLLEAPVMDSTEFGQQDFERSRNKPRFNKDLFKEFK
jgi:hypothetical protein